VPDLPEGYHEVTLSSAEWRVVAAVDGSRLVADLADHVGEAEEHVSLVLRDLVQSGLVVFAEPRVPTAPAVSDISLDAPPMADEDDGRAPWALHAAEEAPTWEADPVVWDEPAPTSRWDEPATPPWSEPAPPAWGPAVEAAPEEWPEPEAEPQHAEPTAYVDHDEHAEPEPERAEATAWAPPSAADLVTEASSVPAVEWEPPVSVAEMSSTAAPASEWTDPWASPPAIEDEPAASAPAAHHAEDVTVTIPVAEPVDRYRDRYAHLYDDVREDESIDDSQYDRTAADLPRRSTMVDDDDDEESRAARRGRGDLPKIDRNVLLRMLSAVKDL
jgi:hypothetical protein